MFLACLALLDYVSRAHEIEIRPSSVRPSVASIISEVTAWIALKFWLWLPLGHMPRLFFIFEIIFFIIIFLGILFVFVNMGAKTSKRYSFNSLLNLFNFFLNVLFSGRHNSTFGFLKFKFSDF